MSREGRLLSVVVVTYSRDRLADLAALLLSLMQQTWRPLEVLVVAETQALRDEIGRRVDELLRNVPAGKGVGLRLLVNFGPLGASGARNEGIRHARGEVIAFLDDDVVAPSEWAQELIATYETDDVVGVAGQAHPLWAADSMRWFPSELHWVVGCTGWMDRPQQQREATSGATVNVSYRRSALLAAGGFSSLLGPRRTARALGLAWAEGIAEDSELLGRVREVARGRVVYNPRVAVGHKVPRDKVGVRWIVRRSLGVGWSRRLLLKRFPNATVLRPEGGLLLRILVRATTRTVMSMPRHPGIACRQLAAMLVAVLGVGFGYTSHALFALLKCAGIHASLRDDAPRDGAWPSVRRED